jgi:hypothetical protein
MTAQVPETVRINGTIYDICGVRGEGLFNPDLYDIETSAPHTACWRGFICGYSVIKDRLLLDTLELWSEPGRWHRNRQALDRLFGERLALDDEQPRIDAHDLAFAVPFTGGLLLGEDFIRELYVHMGFHPAYKYKNVLEVTFESGRLLSQSDRSIEMEEIRLREGRGDGKRSKDVVAWINDCFRIDY